DSIIHKGEIDMNCPNCFSPLRPNQKFCDVCGTKIEAPQMEVDKTVAADKVPTPREPQPAPWEQQTVQPEPQPAPWEQQTAQPEPQPAPWEQQTAQPGMQEPAWQPPQQDAWQPPQPAQDPWQQPKPDAAPDNYSQQYQQYRQPSGMPGTRQGDGSLPPQKNSNLPIIIVAIVLAVLIVGGGVVAAILIFGNKGNDHKNDSSVAASVVQSSEEESSNKWDLSLPDSSTSGQESSHIIQFSRTESSRIESSRIESSRTEPGSSSSGTVSGDSHTIVDKNGLVIAEDDLIQSDDIAAQQQLDNYIKASGTETTITSNSMTGEIFAKGNAIVYEFTYTVALTDEQEELLAERVAEMEDYSAGLVTQIREESGVDNAIIVYAYVSVDGRLLASLAVDAE
ncbi:MAG: DUF4854 domain-containing protein, partial [Ruminococcus sp.]|nr:DUF4854 domain-containing protein [Ruminococcus sp.]